MPYPISVKKNDYTKNVKKSSIQTPPNVCQFLYELISPFMQKIAYICDPCAGEGNLLGPFIKNNYTCYGFEITDFMDSRCFKANYLLLTKDWFKDDEINRTNLILINPPFNQTETSKEYLRVMKKTRAFLPELFLDKTWELFGTDIPCVCFVPMGMRLNQRRNSTRFKKMRDDYPAITSIISLPIDIFPDVIFHSEILIFNLPELKPHYFLTEEELNG